MEVEDNERTCRRAKASSLFCVIETNNCRSRKMPSFLVKRKPRSVGPSILQVLYLKRGFLSCTYTSIPTFYRLSSRCQLNGFDLVNGVTISYNLYLILSVMDSLWTTEVRNDILHDVLRARLISTLYYAQNTHEMAPRPPRQITLKQLLAGTLSPF